MILAGEIGATRTRLAAFETEGSRLQLVVEKDYTSQQHDGLSGILADFIKTEGIPVHSACLGVAGPVRAGRSKISNLPWVIDAREVAKQLRLDSVGLLNDLEAYAYGIDGLESKDFISLSEGSEEAEGNRAVISAKTGLGNGGALLGWIPASSFCLRRRTRRLRSPERSADGVDGLPAEEIRPHQLRARSLRARDQEHLRLFARCAQGRGAGVVANGVECRARSSSSDLANGLGGQGRDLRPDVVDFRQRLRRTDWKLCAEFHVHRWEFSSEAVLRRRSCPR